MRKRVPVLEACPVCGRPMFKVNKHYQTCFENHVGLIAMRYEVVEVDDDKAKEGEEYAASNEYPGANKGIQGREEGGRGRGVHKHDVPAAQDQQVSCLFGMEGISAEKDREDR